MLDEICAHLRNYFVKDVYTARFEIKNGTLVPSDRVKIANGQYVKVEGSVFNDGVYTWPLSDRIDEIFDGEIWAMAIPPALIALADEIKKYEESDCAKPSTFKSESFDGYSYTRSTGADGAPLSWKTVFAKRLNRWRKL